MSLKAKRWIFVLIYICHVQVCQILLKLFSDPGPVHRPVHRAGVPGKKITFSIFSNLILLTTTGGVHGVPEGQRDRGPQLREGDGLPGGAQLPGDLRGRARHVRQERVAERGEEENTLNQNNPSKRKL